MNLTYKNFLILLVIASCILFLGNSGNPPDGNSGAPFNGLCTNCHGGGNYDGTVNISGFPANIAPNTTYPITLTITANMGSPVVGGFQLVAVDANNVNSGDLIAGSGSGTTFYNGKEYLDQRGSKLFSGNTVSWNFNWISPNGPSGTLITMYFSSNLANGNGNTSGDKIIKSDKTGTLTGGTPLSVNIIAKKNISCFGNSDGYATASAGGGTPPYSYLWSNGKTSTTISNINANTYKITITDAINSKASASITISQPAALSILLNVIKNVTCPGGNDGSILAYSNGGTPPYSFSYSSGLPNNLAAGLYSATVTDANMCSSISSTNINQPDTFSINAITLQKPICPLDSNGLIIIKVDGASPPYSYSWSTGDTIDLLSNKKIGIYNLTVTDARKCKTTKSIQLHSGDTIAPILKVKYSKIYINEYGFTIPKITDFILENIDNCDTMPSLSINKDTFRCTDIGIANFIITSTDLSGNKTQDTIGIELLDTLRPVIFCPKNLTIDCEISTTPNFTGFATALDNCTELINDLTHFDVKQDGICTNNFIISRLWKAVDSFHNSNTCLQTIVIQDTTKPIITCPLNKMISCDVNSIPAISGTASASDNCTHSVTFLSYSDTHTNGNCNANYTINRIWKATDSCGNINKCLQLIFVQDTTRPIITCPKNVTVNCESDETPINTGFIKAEDNCTKMITDIFYTDLKLQTNCNDKYTINRTWGAKDSCGNMNKCDQLITIQDTTSPKIFCPENITIDCAVIALPVQTGIAIAIDNCTDQVTNIIYNDIFINGICKSEYSISRIWTAVDSCGNFKSCLQLINVFDTIRPSIQCPDDITISCKDDNTPDKTGFASSIDNCNYQINNISYIDEIVIDGMSTHYSIARIWKAIDSCGNQNKCLQNIAISDTIKLDSVKITNSGNANDGKIELFINGFDSIAIYDSLNENYINNTGNALSPGEYFVRVYKEHCVFLIGPYKVQLNLIVSNLKVLNLFTFPLPFIDKFTIVSSINSELKYYLLNAQGYIISHGTFKTNTVFEPVDLSPGVYFLKCYNVEYTSTIKLIKL
jgi:hypothetical protein